jgi:hypothetical protein
MALMGTGISIMLPDQRWLGFVLIVLAFIVLLSFGFKKENRTLANISIIHILWIIIGCIVLVGGAMIIRHGFNLVTVKDLSRNLYYLYNK